MHNMFNEYADQWVILRRFPSLFDSRNQLDLNGGHYASNAESSETRVVLRFLGLFAARTRITTLLFQKIDEK